MRNRVLGLDGILMGVGFLRFLRSGRKIKILILSINYGFGKIK